jgi:hypothetical protein
MKILATVITLLLCTPAFADDWHHGGGDWHGAQGHGQEWHGGGGWGWHGGGVDMGNALIGGFVGSVIGNIFAPPPVVIAPAPIIVAPAVPEIQPWTPAWYDYCAAKYHSFVAQTGYYTGYDGQPHFCQ